MKLSDEQIAVIRLKADQSRIVIQTLKDDLLDHLCCVKQNTYRVYRLPDGSKRVSRPYAQSRSSKGNFSFYLKTGWN